MQEKYYNTEYFIKENSGYRRIMMEQKNSLKNINMKDLL